MKKETKVFAVILLGLFMVSLLISVVGAESIWVKITAGRGTDGGMGLASKLVISRILLIALVVFIVYAISSFLPFIPEGKDYINWGISIIIGILAFMFVSAEDIRILLTSYEALGIALTSIIPLVILVVFTAQFRKKDPQMANILNRIVIILFIAYLVFRWITLDPTVLKNSVLIWVYPITAIAMIVWLFIERRVYFKIFKSMLAGEVDEATQALVTDLNAQLQRLQDQKKTAGEDTVESIDKQIKVIKKKIKNTGVTT